MARLYSVIPSMSEAQSEGAPAVTCTQFQTLSSGSPPRPTNFPSLLGRRVSTRLVWIGENTEFFISWLLQVVLFMLPLRPPLEVECVARSRGGLVNAALYHLPLSYDGLGLPTDTKLLFELYRTWQRNSVLKFYFIRTVYSMLADNSGVFTGGSYPITWMRMESKFIFPLKFLSSSIFCLFVSIFAYFR